MMQLIRAEFRKVLTVRSSYLLLTLAFLVAVVLVGGLFFGYNDAANAASNPRALRSALQQSVPLSVLFVSFIVMLSVGHEYRYNTILYSLTSVRSRLRFLSGKYSAGLMIIVGSTIIMALLTIVAFSVGQAIQGRAIMPQLMPGWDYIGRYLLYAIGYGSCAFAVTVLLRSLIGSIAFILIVPGTVEGLLQIAIDDKVRYLPFTALTNIINPMSPVSVLTSAVVIIGYTSLLMSIAAVLFMRRDAN